MIIVGHLVADAATFSLRRPDGVSHFETPWHRAVLVIQDETGNVLRSVEAFASGKIDVRGEGEAPHDVTRPEAAEADKPASEEKGGEPVGDVS